MVYNYILNWNANTECTLKNEGNDNIYDKVVKMIYYLLFIES